MVTNYCFRGHEKKSKINKQINTACVDQIFVIIQANYLPLNKSSNYILNIPNLDYWPMTLLFFKKKKTPEKIEKSHFFDIIRFKDEEVPWNKSYHLSHLNTDSFLVEGNFILLLGSRIISYLIEKEKF